MQGLLLTAVGFKSGSPAALERLSRTHQALWMTTGQSTWPRPFYIPLLHIPAFFFKKKKTQTFVFWVDFFLEKRKKEKNVLAISVCNSFCSASDQHAAPSFSLSDVMQNSEEHNVPCSTVVFQ